MAKRLQEADRIMFIESGMVEAVTDFDGNEFVMERMKPGHIINCNSFLMEDKVHIDLRCAESTKILFLQRDKLTSYLTDKPNISKEL